MKFSFFIALRYMFSRKSHSAISVISWISIISVMTGTMALVIILSVFNGFESMVTKMFSSFDAELQITPAEGKTFHLAEFPLEQIKDINGVEYCTEVIEDNALLFYDSKQYITTLKGVSDDFLPMSHFDTCIIDGKYSLKNNYTWNCVIGQGIAYKLDMYLDDYDKLITINTPKKNSSADNSNPFNSISVRPVGVFSVQQEFDIEYTIVDIGLARQIFDYTDELSSLEIGLAEKANLSKVKSEIEKIIGKEYLVKDRYEQQELMYKIMRSEKAAVFIILSFILFIATFNVIGSLTMLIIDKKRDIAILKSMGCTEAKIKRIFLLEGMMISMFGAIIGVVIGVIFCVIQQKYGIISLANSGSYVTTAYPVDLKIKSIISVLLIDFIIGLLAAYVPSQRLAKQFIDPRSL